MQIPTPSSAPHGSRQIKLAGRQLLVASLAVWAVAAQAQTAASPTRGELLYKNHCIECHTSQVHWREGRQARDWPSLRGQVQRWQAAAGLQWSEADVIEVARHLNDTIYHLPPDPERV